MVMGRVGSLKEETYSAWGLVSVVSLVSHPSLSLSAMGKTVQGGGGEEEGGSLALEEASLCLGQLLFSV